MWGKGKNRAEVCLSSWERGENLKLKKSEEQVKLIDRSLDR